MTVQVGTGDETESYIFPQSFLTSKSCYFARAYTNGMLETTTKLIDLDDVHPAMFDDVADLLVTGSVCQVRSLSMDFPSPHERLQYLLGLCLLLRRLFLPIWCDEAVISEMKAVLSDRGHSPYWPSASLIEQASRLPNNHGARLMFADAYVVPLLREKYDFENDVGQRGFLNCTQEYLLLENEASKDQIHMAINTAMLTIRPKRESVCHSESSDCLCITVHDPIMGQHAEITNHNLDPIMGQHAETANDANEEDPDAGLGMLMAFNQIV